MKTISKLFILSLFVLSLEACKKKKDDNNPSDNSNNTKDPACYLSTSDQTVGGITTTDTYTYNSGGKLYTKVTSIAGFGTTTTYTYDNNLNVIKADEGGGDYTTYTYNNGKLSGSKTYEGNSLDQIDTVYTDNGKPTYKSYNASNELRSVTVYTLSEDNILSMQTTTYDESTGYMEDDVMTTYSSFDDKYSADYVNKKHGLNLFPISKRNPKTTQVIVKTYDNSGNLQSTTTSVINTTYTYNEKNVALTATGNVYVNGSSSASSVVTNNYNYSSCE